MKKQIMAVLLTGSIVMQSALGIAAAETMEQNGSAEINETLQQEETEYVVMSEEVYTGEAGLGLEETEEILAAEEMQEAGIAIVEMDCAKAEVLEQDAFVVVEENVEFQAFISGNEIPLQEDMQTTAETEVCEPVAEWNLRAVNAEAYVHDEAAGEKVKIALLDSGVNYRSQMPVKEHVTVFEGNLEDVLMFTDATGHGTAMASLINASADKESIQGMNTDAEVYSVQVLDESNTGTLGGVVQGIYWAIENEMDIINMSFGTPCYSEILHQAVKDASDAGILLVAAAGNDAGGVVHYPAAYDEVIAVGASNMQGEIADCSTRGSGVDIYAPGEEVLANDTFFAAYIQSGSSIACAQVSAAASVILEKDKTKGSGFVRSLLEGTANRNLDPENGKGLLDVGAAVERYDTFTPEDSVWDGRTEKEALPVFESDAVYALWVNADHEILVNESGAKDKLRLMRVATTFPDTNPDMKVNRRFHGSKNYWVTLKFLVNLAHAYYAHEDVNVVYQNAMLNTELGCIEDSYGKSTIQVIKEYLANDNVFKSSLPDIDESTRHNKAYKIMGVVVHLVGDVYAHRTLVKTEMKGVFDKSHFGNNKWKEFWNLVKDSNKQIEFRNITNYAKKNGCNNKTYEDNPNIVSSRFSYAREAIGQLIGENGAYNFKTNTWNKKVVNHKNTLFYYDKQF